MVTSHFYKALGCPSQGQDCLVFPKLPHTSVHPACEEGQLLGPSPLISTPKPIWNPLSQCLDQRTEQLPEYRASFSRLQVRGILEIFEADLIPSLHIKSWLHHLLAVWTMKCIGFSKPVFPAIK